MFKFRSTLVNQLWRYVQCPQSSHEDCNNFEVAEVASVLFSDDRRPLYLRRPSSTSTTTSNENLVITPAKKKQIQAMLMRLKKTQLETLLKAIQTKGWVYQVYIYCQESVMLSRLVDPPAPWIPSTLCLTTASVSTSKT